MADGSNRTDGDAIREITAALRSRGYAVHAVRTGWVVTRWGLAHPAATLADLRAFAQRAGCA